MPSMQGPLSSVPVLQKSIAVNIAEIESLSKIVKTNEFYNEIEVISISGLFSPSVF